MVVGVTGLIGDHAVKVVDRMQLKQGTEHVPIQHPPMEERHAMEQQHLSNSFALLHVVQQVNKNVFLPTSKQKCFSPNK